MAESSFTGANVNRKSYYFACIDKMHLFGFRKFQSDGIQNNFLLSSEVNVE